MADVIRSGQGPVNWFQQLEDLALVASASPAPQQQACIETLLRLLAMAPARTRLLGYVAPDPKLLFALITAAAWESAAYIFLPSTAGYMASRDGNEHHIVSIVLQGANTESTSSGSTLALAMVSAFALAIVDQGSAETGDGQANAHRGAAGLGTGHSPWAH